MSADVTTNTLSDQFILKRYQIVLWVERTLHLSCWHQCWIIWCSKRKHQSLKLWRNGKLTLASFFHHSRHVINLLIPFTEVNRLHHHRNWIPDTSTWPGFKMSINLMGKHAPHYKMWSDLLLDTWTNFWKRQQRL